jgi:hypothetical protein
MPDRSMTWTMVRLGGGATASVTGYLVLAKPNPDFARIWAIVVFILVAAAELVPIVAKFILELIGLLHRNRMASKYQRQHHQITEKRLKESSGDDLGKLSESYTGMRGRYLGRTEHDTSPAESADDDDDGKQDAPPSLKTVDRPA